MSTPQLKNQIVYYGDIITLRHGGDKDITESTMYYYPPQNDDKQESTKGKGEDDYLIEWQILKEPTTESEESESNNLSSGKNDSDQPTKEPVEWNKPLVLKDTYNDSYLYVESDACNNLYVYNAPPTSKDNIYFTLEPLDVTGTSSTDTPSLRYYDTFRIHSNVKDLGTVCFRNSPSGTVECESGKYDQLKYFVGECTNDSDDDNDGDNSSSNQGFQAIPFVTPECDIDSDCRLGYRCDVNMCKRSTLTTIILWVIRGILLAALLYGIYYLLHKLFQKRRQRRDRRNGGEQKKGNENVTITTTKRTTHPTTVTSSLSSSPTAPLLSAESSPVLKPSTLNAPVPGPLPPSPPKLSVPSTVSPINRNVFGPLDQKEQQQQRLNGLHQQRQYQPLAQHHPHFYPRNGNALRRHAVPIF